MATTNEQTAIADFLDAAAARMRGVDLSPRALTAEDEDVDPCEFAAETAAARTLTGTLGVAYDLLIDQLFTDLQTITTAGGAVEGSMVIVLDELPSQFEDRYTAGFLKQFLAVVYDLGQKLATEYTGPSCVAQELVIELLLNQVESVAAAFELHLDPHWRELAEEFLLEDDDYKLLYQDGPYSPEAFPDSLGMTDVRFEQWFVPFTHQTVNPYAATTPAS
ncbi:hypothetical protein RF644_17625 [Kocuria sp. CPCC 205258]|uniref:hypothetical protein n=1 Tax=Kocuria sp. CPCC 205258 TaxID=3073552 RepID=UPI0034D68413